MPINLGDYEEDASNVNFKFFTKSTGDVPTTLLGTPVISVYKANATGTEKTSAETYITLTVDFDSITGLNHVEIDLSGDAFFAFGEDYQVIITTGTVNAVSAVGTVLASFSIGRDATNIWDRVLTGATHNIASSAGRRLRGLQEFQGYELGAVWIDTVNGAAGTVDFENGTVENPVNTLADANTIAASLGLVRFRIAPGSSITFVASQQAQEFMGSSWNLILGGQDIANTSIIGAAVSGVASGSGTQFFMDCLIGAVTLPADSHIRNSGIAGKQTLLAGDYFYDLCHSGIAGTSTPVWDFAAALNTNLNVRHHSGGVEVQNMGGAGTDTMSLEGYGQLILNANCSGGTIAIRGTFSLTDNAGGAVTLSEVARIDVPQVTVPITVLLPTSLSGGRMRSDVLALNGVTASAANLEASASTILRGTVDNTVVPTTTVFEADDIAEATADHFIGRRIIFTSGVLKNEATIIIDYELNGANAKFTVNQLTDAPGNDDTFVIV